MRFLRVFPVAAVVVAVVGMLRLERAWEEASWLQVMFATMLMLVWLAAPLVLAAWWQARCRVPVTRTLLTLLLVVMGLVWGLVALLLLFVDEFEGQLGLLFGPVLLWIGLFGVFVMQAVEASHHQRE